MVDASARRIVAKRLGNPLRPLVLVLLLGCADKVTTEGPAAIDTDCPDVDLDGCVECAGATPQTDGPDLDADGICDEADGDLDGDGVPNAEDAAPQVASQCRDLDGDGCDDCLRGTPDPADDGPDLDGDGLCDLGDDDDDGDTVADVDDLDPRDPTVCADADADACDDCAQQSPPAPLADGPDLDGDGICDVSDVDVDGDGRNNIDEPAFATDPNRCGDQDLDTCDDCTSGVVDPAEDGIDTDGDGFCDRGDVDDDDNGVRDRFDAAPLDPFACRDSDFDTCDDCVSGISAPAADGPDFDGDGLCDAGDSDDDNDAVQDGFDHADLDPTRCSDIDQDGCDDCASGVFALLDDGDDVDGDGTCDLGDLDNDNDSVLDIDDTDPFDPNVCADVDGDGCDDCVPGLPAPAFDGPDADGDGLCDDGDPDDDGDLVADVLDAAPLDPLACGDDDRDSCDDCSSGTYDLANDGTDSDGDGLCDALRPDSDGDTVYDDEDAAPLDAFACQDLDGDGCDDCASGTPDPFADGDDNDGDGLCDPFDPDDDNDGVSDVDDPDAWVAELCGDSDGDSCDDCARGVDGFGPLPDADPSNDGWDCDGDGICDRGETPFRLPLPSAPDLATVRLTPDLEPVSLAVGPDGTLWLGTADQGTADVAMAFDHTGHTHTVVAPDDGDFLAMAVSPLGDQLAWLATESGPYPQVRLSADLQTMTSSSDMIPLANGPWTFGPANATASTLYWADDDCLWVPNLNVRGSIWCLHPTNTSQLHRFPQGSRVEGTVQAVDDDLFAAVDDGLHGVRPGSAELIYTAPGDILGLTWDVQTCSFFVLVDDADHSVLQVAWYGEATLFDRTCGEGQIALSDDGTLYYLPTQDLLGLRSWSVDFPFTPGSCPSVP
jgi:hypothetical protein